MIVIPAEHFHAIKGFTLTLLLRYRMAIRLLERRILSKLILELERMR